MKKILLAVFLLIAGLSQMTAQQIPDDDEDVVIIKNKKTEPLELIDVQDMEIKPSFPGGNKAMYQWIADNLTYPSESSAVGSVVVSFIVEPDGRITNPQIIRSLEPIIDAEAIRVISKMPRWTPGRHEGKMVRCLYTLPLKFMLQ